MDAEDEINVLRAEVDELQQTVAELITMITKDATPPRELSPDMEPFLVWHGTKQRQRKADAFGHAEFGNPRMAEWIEWGKQSWTRRTADDESRKDR